MVRSKSRLALKSFREGGSPSRVSSPRASASERRIARRLEAAMQVAARAMRSYEHGGTRQTAEFAESVQGELLACDNLLAARPHAQVHAALETAGRIAQGTYGICLACGKPIPAKRLLAVHFTSLCIGCQELRENQAMSA